MIPEIENSLQLYENQPLFFRSFTKIPFPEILSDSVEEAEEVVRHRKTV